MVANDQYLRTLGMREGRDRVTQEFLTQGPIAHPRRHGRLPRRSQPLHREGQTPLEYELLGMDPEPFDTHDMYCATGFMAYSFAIHLKTEPILDWMKQNFDPAYMADLALGWTGSPASRSLGSPSARGGF